MAPNEKGPILTQCKFRVQSWYCPYYILLMTECKYCLNYGFIWYGLSIFQNVLITSCWSLHLVQLISTKFIKSPHLSASKIPLGFSEMTKYEWVQMLSELRFCLMWYLYLLKVLHHCSFLLFYSQKVVYVSI